MKTNYKIGDIVAYIHAKDFINDKFKIVADKHTPFNSGTIEIHVTKDILIVKESEHLENFIDVDFSDLREIDENQ